MSTNAIEKNEADTRAEGGFGEHLHTPDEERRYLETELGTSDACELVLMVRSLEAQLVDLYQAKEEGEQK